MTVATYNWTWQEGEDLVISLVYKEGALNAEVPVDLTGYQLRMDLVSGDTRVATLNSNDIADPTVDNVGTDDNEVTLGADGLIHIIVPRSLSLPGGAVASLFVDSKNIVLHYDIFLRNPDGLQSKILRGIITVERSYTKWA